MTNSVIILFVALFLLGSSNFTFFSKLLDAYPPILSNIPHIISSVAILGCINVILLSLMSYGRSTKFILILILLISSVASYFMDSYNVILDSDMIDNILKTDIAESLDLISTKLIIYIVSLGMVPAYFVYRAPIIEQTLKQAIISRSLMLGGSLAVIIASLMIYGNFYSSLAREHKSLRYYTNPAYYLYALGKTIYKSASEYDHSLTRIAEDANIHEADDDRELMIVVVGETARADRFSLNGYKRKTNPLLSKENVVSFSNLWACGTSTAASLPCMFSIYGHDDFNKEKAKYTENLLDILQRSGVNVIWLDNNSDSKGVALRVPYQSYKSEDNNPICDSECRDEGMLINLQNYIDNHPDGDILIVLHQMGNHGPSYFKRYPTAFEHFKPVCSTNELADCTRVAINNAYDNAILYTDYFLTKVISLLKKNEDQFESGMIYISDHGESLGENNIYLHGLPYLFAPDAQKRVPMIVWFSDSFSEDDISVEQLKPLTNKKYSHDNLFHTLLGIFEVDTDVYDFNKDLLNSNSN